MQNTNLILSKTKESKSRKISSESTGFENVGKFHKHIRKISKKINENEDNKKLHIKSLHRDLYMIMVDYCFGYTNNIQYELQISIQQLVEESGSSDKSITSALKLLEQYNLIKRVKWQNNGPKQVYKYSVVFPENYNIIHKKTEEELKKKTIEELDDKFFCSL